MKLKRIICGPENYFEHFRWQQMHQVYVGGLGGAALLVYFIGVIVDWLYY